MKRNTRSALPGLRPADITIAGDGNGFCPRFSPCNDTEAAPDAPSKKYFARFSSEQWREIPATHCPVVFYGIFSAREHLRKLREHYPGLASITT
jgi:hypothetical protein